MDQPVILVLEGKGYTHCPAPRRFKPVSETMRTDEHLIVLSHWYGKCQWTYHDEATVDAAQDQCTPGRD
jgi:hypothetical protein